jgi:hypothetical protein
LYDQHRPKPVNFAACAIITRRGKSASVVSLLKTDAKMHHCGIFDTLDRFRALVPGIDPTKRTCACGRARWHGGAARMVTLSLLLAAHSTSSDEPTSPIASHAT